MGQTFKDFLQEDVAADVAKLQADIANTDAAIQQRTASLVTQRQRLQKMLAMKMKQKEQEDKQKGQQQQAAQQPATPGQVPPQ